MKKSTIIILVAVAVLAIGSVSSYNSLVSMDEIVAEKWANIEAQYQRRSDLIPNLVNTVKGYAAHETQTLENVVNARAKATQVTVSADELTPERLRQIQATQGELSAALGRLMAISEQYPDLKANSNFSELQAQLEGTENRINESRRLYNESVRIFNTNVRRFPKNIIASIFGFEKKTAFEAENGASETPTVEF